MESARLPDISESFDSMWIEYVLTSPLIDVIELRSFAQRFEIVLRGKLSGSRDHLAQALLARVSTRKLVAGVRDLVTTASPSLLPYKEAKQAYAAFSKSNGEDLVELIRKISSNDDLKRELASAIKHGAGALRFAPPGLLKRVVLAELYTISGEEAVRRLKKSGVPI